MALTQRLELRQGQSLVMTPQLQQAIKLLQMSNFELQAFVEAEIEKNPLLERDEKLLAAAKPEAPAAAEEGADTDLRAQGSAADKLERLDTDLQNVYADESRADAANRMAAQGPTDSGWSSMRPTGNVPMDSDGFDLDSTLSRGKTLCEHVEDQLAMSHLSAADRLIGQHIAATLDEAGYLTADTAAIAEVLGATEPDVERVLAVIQNFEPAGIGARNLRECLIIQLKERDRYDPAMAALVDHLELIAKRDFPALKTVCGVDLDDIKDMISEIRQLDPKPGHVFGSDPVQPVVPDVFVRPAPDGTWIVELNSETLPKVLVNRQYMATVAANASRDEDKTYLTECHANAAWLVKSLDQRAKTILKVAREIVRQQDAFLVLGVRHLRPLNLKTVAEAIGMHESTVSRVTSNKYVATPRGSFELKYFFTTAIASAEGGDAHSAEAVRDRIRAMIGEESATNVLSDDAIVDILKVQGIEIARRTVAKYRESLNIPSSVQRRREKLANFK